MKNCVVVLGSGGREYAIIKRLKEDSIKLNKDINIICVSTNKNDMLKDYCNMVTLSNNLNDSLYSIIYDNSVFLAIIGSEDFLIKGVGDFFEKNNIPCIGPNLICSRLETSKFFCRTYIENICKLQKYNPKFDVFYNSNNLVKNLDRVNKIYKEYVIKKDGLNRGKGVFVENHDFERNENSISKLNLDNSILVVEEKFIGKEFSLMSIVDTKNNIVHFPPIMDYKRLENDNKGCNTGGMGCVIDSNNTLPFLNDEDISIAKNINSIIIEKMGNYRGILYGSFMKTKDGIKIIEFNCRFGDPECILAINMIEDNFYNICMNFVDGNLTNINFSKKAQICVYVVPKSYCKKMNDSYKYDLYFNEKDNLDIIYSNIESSNGHIYSLKSRCFALKNSDESLYNCFQTIYNQLNNIHGNIHYRTDIGAEFLSVYETCGVSISQASKSLEEIKSNIISTYNKNVVSNFGSFGGEYKLNDNILVCSIDGVGTKTLFAQKYKGNKGYVNLGKDIVSHSINDILVQGAYPLFFLDYYGCNNLKIDELTNFIYGISCYCKQFGNIPIMGGETAEMYKVYKNNCTDLIGCIIGLKEQQFQLNSICSGDLIINLPSNGPHTNGFSLINNIEDIDNDMVDILLTPHKCYLNEVNDFIDIFGFEKLHCMCHITGGGLYENLNRVVKDKSYKIDINFDNLPNWSKYLKNKCNIDNDELLKVFNCGFGFILIADKCILDSLYKYKYEYEIVGKIL